MKISESLEVDGLLDKDVPKKVFKRTVKTAAKERNDSDIRDDMSKYKKMSILRSEERKKNEYIKEENIPNARVLFKHRSDMFDSKLNFKNNVEFKKNNYMCDSCESEVDDNLHVLYCESYKDLRKGKNLDDNKDLGMYLQKVLHIRTKLRLEK